jgi:hypothetical protein
MLPGRTINKMERVAGIEPACTAWKAVILPLNYTRMWSAILTQKCLFDNVLFAASCYDKNLNFTSISFMKRYQSHNFFQYSFLIKWKKFFSAQCVLLHTVIY